MNNDASPGLGRQSTVRTVARVVAAVLLAVGVVLVVLGIRAFLDLTDQPSAPSGFEPAGSGFEPLAPSGFESILIIGAGGFCVIFGLAAANVGWLGAQASYVAGETMPVVKESATYLSDGQGIAGIGRTAVAPVQQDAVGHGPYCRGCGTRNDSEAKFCDSCGQSLA